MSLLGDTFNTRFVIVFITILIIIIIIITIIIMIAIVGIITFSHDEYHKTSFSLWLRLKQMFLDSGLWCN